MPLTDPIIRVQGRGCVSTSPDEVVLTLVIAHEDRDYGKAVAGMNQRVEALRRAVAQAEEDPKALKTTSFQITTENDYVHGRHQFRGFCGEHRLELRLAFEHSRLGRVFSAVAGSDAKPQISMAFCSSDPEAIRQRVLADAVGNARRRAEVIAAAAGRKLGRIVAMDYGYTEIRVSSDQYAMGAGAVAEAPLELEPAEIESSDTVQIAWELAERDSDQA